VFGNKKREKVRNLFATGSKGVGTVISVQDTGVTMNDNPRVKMTFRIEPLEGGAPFEAHKTSTVSRLEIPRAGDRYPCWYDASDPTTWAYATIAAAEGREQIRMLFGAQAETLTGFGGGGVAVAAAPAAAPAADPLDRLKKLDELHSTGVLTDAEFQAKKAELLAQL
jgi:hypothetical protein